MFPCIFLSFLSGYTSTLPAARRRFPRGGEGEVLLPTHPGRAGVPAKACFCCRGTRRCCVCLCLVLIDHPHPVYHPVYFYGLFSIVFSGLIHTRSPGSVGRVRPHQTFSSADWWKYERCLKYALVRVNRGVPTLCGVGPVGC